MSWRPKRYWHTQILAVLKKVRSFYLTDVRHAPEDHAALVQAAAELAAEGEIRVLEATGFGTIIYRPTDGIPDPPTVGRLKPLS